MEKLDCHWCGAKILPATANKTDGLCVPCSREVVKKWKPPASSAAYNIAALFLLINSLSAVLTLIYFRIIGVQIIGIIIELVLAYLLFKQDSIDLSPRLAPQLG